MRVTSLWATTIFITFVCYATSSSHTLKGSDYHSARSQVDSSTAKKKESSDRDREANNDDTTKSKTGVRPALVHTYKNSDEFRSRPNNLTSYSSTQSSLLFSPPPSSEEDKLVLAESSHDGLRRRGYLKNDILVDDPPLDGDGSLTSAANLSRYSSSGGKVKKMKLKRTKPPDSVATIIDTDKTANSNYDGQKTIGATRIKLPHGRSTSSSSMMVAVNQPLLLENNNNHNSSNNNNSSSRSISASRNHNNNSTDKLSVSARLRTRFSASNSKSNSNSNSNNNSSNSIISNNINNNSVVNVGSSNTSTSSTPTSSFQSSSTFSGKKRKRLPSSYHQQSNNTTSVSASSAAGGSTTTIAIPIFVDIARVNDSSSPRSSSFYQHHLDRDNFRGIYFTPFSEFGRKTFSRSGGTNFLDNIATDNNSSSSYSRARRPSLLSAHRIVPPVVSVASLNEQQQQKQQPEDESAPHHHHHHQQEEDDMDVTKERKTVENNHAQSGKLLSTRKTDAITSLFSRKSLNNGPINTAAKSSSGDAINSTTACAASSSSSSSSGCSRNRRIIDNSGSNRSTPKREPSSTESTDVSRNSHSEDEVAAVSTTTVVKMTYDDLSQEVLLSSIPKAIALEAKSVTTTTSQDLLAKLPKILLSTAVVTSVSVKTSNKSIETTSLPPLTGSSIKPTNIRSVVSNNTLVSSSTAKLPQRQTNTNNISGTGYLKLNSTAEAADDKVSVLDYSLRSLAGKISNYSTAIRPPVVIAAVNRSSSAVVVISSSPDPNIDYLINDSVSTIKKTPVIATTPPSVGSLKNSSTAINASSTRFLDTTIRKNDSIVATTMTISSTAIDDTSDSKTIVDQEPPADMANWTNYTDAVNNRSIRVIDVENKTIEDYNATTEEYNDKEFFEEDRSDTSAANRVRHNLRSSYAVGKHANRGEDVGITYQAGFHIITYVLAGLGVIPLLIGIFIVSKLLMSHNRKQIFEGSEYSSEYNRSPLEVNTPVPSVGITSSPIATKLPRVSHHMFQNHWEIEKKAACPPSVFSVAAPPLDNNSKWEFPRDKLRLQTILGQGNFGQVWKAEADDITGHEGLTRLVAVKMVKEISSTREKEDLIRELLIMQQLGSHPNVVTLLGCCTEKEPYMLIMEYVMYGKLLAFLRDHRARSHYFNFSDSGGDMLTSRDLTVFGYCVARGMDFLASKQIVHRDLAARNILVDHNKLCKIADFGMSRHSGESGEVHEHRQSKGALPIRWMAPESLHYNVYTQKTDVWSFGILMWEIITLGSMPYATMGARVVMKKVKEGYRLEKPKHCKSQLFNIISKCWNSDANKRPSFADLKQELGNLLDDNEHQGNYVDLESLIEDISEAVHSHNERIVS